MTEVNELRTFLAVADTGSFSKAAKTLHVTQPAVSKRIQSLEAGLGVQLFDRVGKRVYLTDGGNLLRPRAEALMKDLRDTETALKNLHQRVDGRLALATSHHVGLHRLAPVLRAFTRRYPDVHLDLSFVDSEDAHDLVLRADVELAVVTLNPEGDADLTYRHIWHDPLVFVAASDHPLTTQMPVPLRVLAQQPAVLPGLGTFTGRIVRARFREANLPLTASMSTNYLETLGMLVGIGIGWSLLPRTMVTGSLTVLEVADEPLGRDLGAVTNPDRTLSNSARAFLEVLGEFADTQATGKDCGSGF
jgi:DNA-binding transcriptional LysR family regulator